MWWFVIVTINISVTLCSIQSMFPLLTVFMKSNTSSLLNYSCPQVPYRDHFDPSCSPYSSVAWWPEVSRVTLGECWLDLMLQQRHLDVAVPSSCILLGGIWCGGRANVSCSRGGPDIHSLPLSWLHFRMTLSLLVTCLKIDRDRQTDLIRGGLLDSLQLYSQNIGFTDWPT